MPSGSLAQEADQQAQSLWNSKLTRCGEHYFTTERDYIYQLKNFRISTVAKPVSAADRLNGIEWLGRTTVTAGPSRTYRPAQQWSSWSDGMSGLELYADLRKANGRWTFTDGMGSRSGDLRPVSCADATNAAAFFRRREANARNNAFNDFIARAPQRGLYSNNLSLHVWDALFKTSPSVGANFTVNTHVYLAGNGGWLVCGYPSGYPSAPGCLESNLPRPAWAADLPKDADIQIGAADPNDIPEGLARRLAKWKSTGFITTAFVRVGYQGEWFAMSARRNPRPNCSYCGTRRFWEWGGLPDAADAVLKDLAAKATANSGSIMASVESPMRDLVFAPNGGYVILTDNRNGYVAQGIPPDALQLLSKLRASNLPINKVTFGPNGSWIILANGDW